MRGEKWCNDVVDRREDFAVREHRKGENENIVFLVLCAQPRSNHFLTNWPRVWARSVLVPPEVANCPSRCSLLIALLVILLT